MRKILAITVALMIAAIVIMPALGYTNQAAGNQSYTAKSGDRIDYSLKTLNVPAHNLTPDQVVNKYSFKSAAVQSTRLPYTFQEGAVASYSFRLLGVENAVAEGMKTKKPVAKLGSMMKNAEPAAAPVVEPVAAPVVEPAAAPVVEPVTAPVVEPATAPVVEPVTAPVVEPATAPVVEPVEAPVNETKFTIEGMVVDNNQTGLAGWTISLTMNGSEINSVSTAADGKFAFSDLAAGEYSVSEVLMEGWSIITPVDDKSAVTITNASVTDLVFVNQLV